MRRNVLTWLVSQVPSARHALILTHNIDFLFVQSVLGPKLRQAGNPRLTIFCDANCAIQSFHDQRALIDGLGVRYRVVPVDLGAGRRFHPKALLLAGQSRAALAIGSGNLTHGGMSANHEAWSYAASDSGGGASIAAFRDYVRRIISYLPLSDQLLDTVDSIFDSGDEWAATLPDPGGLVGSPHDVPMLDQITALLAGDLQSVSVLSPYYDEKGAALSAIATRFNVPLTCWVQSSRAGLWQGAANLLPSNVTLKSVECQPDRRPSFIHAKVLAFHRDEDVVMFVGSANCSQAALLADTIWGNAELMSVGTISRVTEEELFSELVLSDDPPTLPEQSPADEWAPIQDAPFRILATRHEGDRLDVSFRADSALDDFVIEADEGSWPENNVNAAERIASFLVPRRLRTISLNARAPNGERLVTREFWVDDEASLSAPASLRRLVRRLQDDGSSDPTDSFRGVIELFREYIRDPEAARRKLKRRQSSTAPPAEYDPAAVFSDEFGKLVSIPQHGANRGDPDDIFSIIESLFAVNSEVGGSSPSGGKTLPQYIEEEFDPEAAGVELVQKNNRREPDEKAKIKLHRALAAMREALSEPAFVETRSPALLSADIALFAVLLVKGLSDHLIDVELFREITRSLWSALFLGQRQVGSVVSRLEAIGNEEERRNFISAFASSRLASALAIWSTPEWSANDKESNWFRFSAAQLYLRCPWLFAPASADTIVAGIDAMAAGLIQPSERTFAVRTWGEIVRSGEALKSLYKSLGEKTIDQLKMAAKATSVGTGDLVWAGLRLGFPVTAFSREGKTKGHVLPIGEAAPLTYFASRVLPVRELVQSGALALPDGAEREVLRFIDSSAALNSAG